MTDFDAIEYLKELKTFNEKDELITPKNKELGYDTFYQCALIHAIRALEEKDNTMANREDDWIYCGDGKNLPEKEGFYLVSLSEQIHHGDDNLAVKKCWYNEETQSFSEYGKFVMAWQPLPSKYVIKDTDIVGY